MKKISVILAFAMLITLCGCTQLPPSETSAPSMFPTSPTQTEQVTEVPTEEATEEVTEEATEAPTEMPTQAPTQEPTEEPTESTGSFLEKKLIVIDAGHQRHGNKDKEPVGPGATEMKTKVAAGTSGCVSGYDEYEINLIVALQLQQELLDRGYDVLMIRTTHDVDISNADRARIANEASADAVIRIHCNGSDNPEAHGALTICQTANNPYQPQLYTVNHRLAQCVIDAFVEATGCYDRGVWETDTMTGLNWCSVPNCFVELGFMSNPEEDSRMASPEYQEKMVQGIANGLDAFFG